jgi:hypothetical protein
MIATHLGRFGGGGALLLVIMMLFALAFVALLMGKDK